MTSRSVTLLPLAARTASVNGSDFASQGCRGIVLAIVATASSATPSVVVKLQGKDSLGNYYDITGASATAVTGAGTSTLTVYPGAPVTSGVSSSQPIPKVCRIVATAADSDSLTYSVSGLLVR